MYSFILSMFSNFSFLKSLKYYSHTFCILILQAAILKYSFQVGKVLCLFSYYPPRAFWDQRPGFRKVTELWGCPQALGPGSRQVTGCVVWKGTSPFSAPPFSLCFTAAVMRVAFLHQVLFYPFLQWRCSAMAQTHGEKKPKPFLL